MCVHDRAYGRARSINPEVKAVGWVRHPLAFQQVQIVVDQQKVSRRNLVEASPKRSM
jgi:hypothetical protein